MRGLVNFLVAAMILVVGWRAYTTWSASDPLYVRDDSARGAKGLDLPSTARTPAPPRLAAGIADRDLFDESRKAPSEQEEVEAEPVPPPDAELIGVLIGGPQAEALVRVASEGNEVRHVYVGDDVGGYTVSSITPTEVVLISPGGGEVPLPLPLNRSSAPGKGGKRPVSAAQKRKEDAKAAEAAASKQRARSTTAAGVRERLRELRRKRREANRGRR